MMRQRDRRPPRGSEFLIHRLDRQLNLTPQQETQIRTILAAREQRIQSIWSTVRPEVRREIDQTNAEIARVLTPDQRREFEKIKMRMVPRHGTPMMPH